MGLYHGILWYIMVFVIQMYCGILWYAMVNHETVPWCTVVYYGICDPNVALCTMVNYAAVPWYIMVLYHGLCFTF